MTDGRAIAYSERERDAEIVTCFKQPWILEDVRNFGILLDSGKL